MFSVICILYFASCILFSLSYFMYSVFCIPELVSCILYSVSCVMYVSCILFSLFCFLFPVFCIPCLVSCIFSPYKVFTVPRIVITPLYFYHEVSSVFMNNLTEHIYCFCGVLYLITKLGCS